MSDGTFRLKVTDILSSQDERVAVVTVEANQSERYSIGAKSLHLGDGLLTEKVDEGRPYQERILTFVASRVAPDRAEHDYIKAILKRGKEVVMTDAREFPRDTPLASKVTLTVRDGIYPLAKPLVIGRLYGEDLLLSVGDPSGEAGNK